MFCSELDLRAERPGRWLLLRSLVWDGEQVIVVPAGFVTDLASIPRGLRSILNQNGRSRRPAVLHDYGYHARFMDREATDGLFLDALLSEGVNSIVARMYWLGVRACGWLVWNSREAR